MRMINVTTIFEYALTFFEDQLRLKKLIRFIVIIFHVMVCSVIEFVFSHCISLFCDLT